MAYLLAQRLLAQRTGAVLIFDEVDSFLTDRGQARYSWERMIQECRLKGSEQVRAV
ncbi:hypothetical protein [Halochromatium roseum]|uniref:hypothetical protein n=1 Tax=Halochromatium roseum TaxID=391920 RepID=UPI001913ACD5|nr:hypothetical protein [Halochromatium roseum]